jgi:hypothetical protein
MFYVKNKRCARNYCSTLDESCDKNSFCRQCTRDFCCMKDELDSFGRSRCNQLLPLKLRNESYYCRGHWNSRIKRCKECNSNRVKMHRDDWSYCAEHMPDEKTCLAMVINDFPLPNDVSKRIFDLSLSTH